MNEDTNKAQVIELELSQIKPYWRNPRKGNVEAVKQSIKDYGYNQFIVVDKENVIIVGHSRYKALLELGYTKVRCIVADLSPEKAKAYRIVDNQTSDLSYWDEEMLSTELKELSDTAGFDAYFSKDELDRLISQTIGATEYKGVDQNEIDESKQELDEVIQNIDQNRHTKPRTVTCPECGHEFQIGE